MKLKQHKRIRSRKTACMEEAGLQEKETAGEAEESEKEELDLSIFLSCLSDFQGSLTHNLP